MEANAEFPNLHLIGSYIGPPPIPTGALVIVVSLSGATPKRYGWFPGGCASEAQKYIDYSNGWGREVGFEYGLEGRFVPRQEETSSLRRPVRRIK